MDPIGSFFWRASKLQRRFARMRAARWVSAYNTKLPIAFAQFADLWKQPLLPYEPERARFILELLELVKPRFIVELGSGTSTAWFAAYARRHGAKVISIDQNEQWLAAAIEAARGIAEVEGVLSEVQLIDGVGGVRDRCTNCGLLLCGWAVRENDYQFSRRQSRQSRRAEDSRKRS